jgi:hypothetical protein
MCYTTHSTLATNSRLRVLESWNVGLDGNVLAGLEGRQWLFINGGEIEGRISVKRELGLSPAAPGAAAHPGYISNVLHDTFNILESWNVGLDGNVLAGLEGRQWLFINGGEIEGGDLIHDAWATAYWQLADIMIGREKQIYEQAEGWTDWRASWISGVKAAPSTSAMASRRYLPTIL